VSLRQFDVLSRLRRVLLTMKLVIDVFKHQTIIRFSVNLLRIKKANEFVESWNLNIKNIFPMVKPFGTSSTQVRQQFDP